MGRYLELLEKMDIVRPRPLVEAKPPLPAPPPPAPPVRATTKTTETTKVLDGPPPTPPEPEPVGSEAHRQEWRRRVLEMPLDRFAREGCPVELSFPGCQQTMFFVPGSREVEYLTARGIGRGRIWTVAEFRRLWLGPIISVEHAQTLARLKADLGCELEKIDPFTDPHDPPAGRGPA